MEPETSLRIALKLGSRFGLGTAGLPEKAHILNAYEIQWWVIYRWTIPVIVLSSISFLVGVFLAKRRFKSELGTRELQESGKGTFRGMTISMDVLPMPTPLPRRPLTLSGPNAEKILGSMTESQKNLFMDVLETLHAHPRAFVGDGHFGNLLEHSLNVVERLIGKADEHCPLAFVAAAAHDLGKIEAWKEIDLPEPAEEPDWFKWVRTKLPTSRLAKRLIDHVGVLVTPATEEVAPNAPQKWKQLSGVHDQLSARIVVKLPSYPSLPPHERDALYFSLAYDHNRNGMPQLPSEKADRLARKMMSLVQEADSKATKEEKTKVLASIPVEAQVIRAFRDVLPSLQFQGGEAAGAKKQATVGFHLGDGLVIFFESQIKEKCMERLPPETRAALGGVYRDQGKLSEFTVILIKEFHKLGWLVTEWDKWEGSEVSGKVDARLWTKVKTGEKWKLPATDAVWNVISNIHLYNCMIIAQLPEELLYSLPIKTKYRIVVKEPHFKNTRTATLKESSVPAEASIIRSADILGGLLGPAAVKPVVVPGVVAIPVKAPFEAPKENGPVGVIPSLEATVTTPPLKRESNPPRMPNYTGKVTPPKPPLPPTSSSIPTPTTLNTAPPVTPRPAPKPLPSSNPLAGLFSTPPSKD